MGLSYHYAFSAPDTTSADALEDFLHEVEGDAVLLAGHVIVNVVASAFFAAVEPVSLSHNCIHSDEFTTVDLGSGREQVGVTQGRPELNPAGTSAGTRLWKLTKPYSSNWLGLEARVGIGRLKRVFSPKNAHFHD